MQFVKFNRSSNAHIPVRKMLVQGGGLAAVFGVIAVCILGAGTNNRLVRGMMDLVKTAAYYIARAIAVCISFLLSLFSGKEGEMIEEGAAAGQMDMGLSEAAATPAWLDVLIKITEYLMAALTIALICFLLYRLVLAAVKKFYEKVSCRMRKKDRPQRSGSLWNGEEKEREGKASSFSDQDTGTKDKKIFYPYRKKAGSAEGLQDRKGAAGDSSCA